MRDERFRLGIEGSGIGIWDLDLSTHRLLWSNITRTLFGVPNDLPLTYELFLSLLEPQDRERTDQAVKRSVETGCSFDMQYQVDGPSQLHHWVRARGSVVRDEHGVPRHLSGLVIDIDDQKQVEEALRIRESHLRSILETIPDAMIVIDGSGIMQFFSSAAERQFGYLATRSDRSERQHADAKPGSFTPRRLSGPVSRPRASGISSALDES